MDKLDDVLPVLTFVQESEIKQINEVEMILCLKCEKMYEFPDKKDDYLGHLFLVHRLVIADVEDVAMLEEYFKYWKNEFKDHELEEYCTTMLLDQLPDGTPAKNEKYYLLSDILPKDFELRKQLQQQRLQKVLVQHQFERTDRDFCKECLYCRDVIKGLRSDFIEHLFSKHFLQLGKPENLVYVDELLAKVEDNLNGLICLYCEKVFKDRVTLKEHMRKKGHKRINPNNRMYDKYFLLNYRERNEKVKLYRNQEKYKHRKQSTNTSKFLDEEEKTTANAKLSCNFDKRFSWNNSDNSDSDWSDWDEGEKLPPLNCFFCERQDPDFEALKQHMRAQHCVNFDVAVKDLNFYQKIKLVNYVRRQMCLLRCVTCNVRYENRELLREHMEKESHYSLGARKQWDKPEFFFPTYEDDGLLCVLDDSPNDDIGDTIVRIISEDTVVQINKDAERLSLENFPFS